MFSSAIALLLGASMAFAGATDVSVSISTASKASVVECTLVDFGPEKSECQFQYSAMKYRLWLESQNVASGVRICAVLAKELPGKNEPVASPCVIVPSASSTASIEQTTGDFRIAIVLNPERPEEPAAEGER